MKYPRLKLKDDRRRKVSPRDITAMKTMHRNGEYKSNIAKVFNVSPNTVAYWLDDALRERKKKQVLAINLERQKRDPAYRAYVVKNIKAYFARRLQDPAFKEYNNSIKHEPKKG